MKVQTCLEKTAISSLKDSDEQTSPPATPGSLGVQVANSHFSKMRANSGKSGCLKIQICIHKYIKFETRRKNSCNAKTSYRIRNAVHAYEESASEYSGKFF